MPHKFTLPKNIIFTFETERLIVRPLEAQDKEFYISLYTDPKIMRLITKPFSQERANQAFQATLKAMHKSIALLAPSTMTWVIIDKQKKRLGIQSADFRPASDANMFKKKPGATEIGIMLDKQAHGKNIPQEAITRLAMFCIKQLKVNNIFCTYDKKNFAVSRFIKQVGFIKHPRITHPHEHKEYQYLPNHWVDKQ